MARDLRLPELGENVHKADILSVLVEPGQRVEKDQPILEIGTDKATIEAGNPGQGGTGGAAPGGGGGASGTLASRLGQRADGGAPFSPGGRARASCR
jgi:hypothetical protein